MKRKRYSRKFQRMAVERMRTCEHVGELARELGVRPRCLYKWRAKLEAIEPGEEASRPSTHTASYRKEIQQLKRLLAEKTLEVDFFKGALHGPESLTPLEAEYIGADQLPLFVFRLQLCGGPYIPIIEYSQSAGSGSASIHKSEAGAIFLNTPSAGERQPVICRGAAGVKQEGNDCALLCDVGVLPLANQK